MAHFGWWQCESYVAEKNQLIGVPRESESYKKKLLILKSKLLL